MGDNHTATTVPQPQWYVALQGRTHGPVDAATLHRWAGEGRISWDLQVLPVGGEQWMPYTAAPELRGLAVVAPPSVPPAMAGPPAPAASHRTLCDCPACGGPVENVAPVYGWPWGFWQRSLRPQFACRACGTKVAYEDLPAPVQARVTRGVRVGFILWVIVIVLVFAAIASPFIVAAMYR
jgi:hypothetical protein